MGLPLVASTTGVKVSAYLRTPSGQAESHEAEAHLIAFLTAVGDIDPKESLETVDHCSDCVMSGVSLDPSISQDTSPLRYELINDIALNGSIGFHALATGPPLGGRAPPLFL